MGPNVNPIESVARRDFQAMHGLGDTNRELGQGFIEKLKGLNTIKVMKASDQGDLVLDQDATKQAREDYVVRENLREKAERVGMIIREEDGLLVCASKDLEPITH